MDTCFLLKVCLSQLFLTFKNDNTFSNPKNKILSSAGRIDQAHHENRARIALDETKQLHQAVDYVTNQADLSDTLIVVTADHSHTMSIGGYPVNEIERVALHRFLTNSHTF